MIRTDTFASSELAVEIGLNAAVVVNKIEYWAETGYGEVVDGVTYVWNTMKDWHNQFPWMCLRTLKSVFKKLVDLEIIFKRKHGRGYDQTRSYGINYSNPIVQNLHNGLGKDCTMESAKIAQCYNTDTTTENTQRPTPVSTGENHSSREPYHNRTRTKRTSRDLWKQAREKVAPLEYRKNWPRVEKWLLEQSGDFQEQVDKYAEDQINNPKRRVLYPTQYKQGVIHKIWLDETQGSDLTDFKYIEPIDLSTYKPAPVVRTRVVSFEEKMGADHTFDEEMQRYMEQGGME
jgi:hypothetical protein